jgi:16S rRNA (cytosine967-C5)-methyltransferase
MPASPARIAAFDILLRVEQEHSYASELLHSRAYEKLKSADHRLTTELVMGVLRWRLLLDRHIAESASHGLNKMDAEVLTALRLGAYQLEFLARVPARAAIHESAELIKRARKRSAVAFVNAVLRKIQQAPRPDEPFKTIADSKNTQGLSDSSAHPPWLAERWITAFGLDSARELCAYNQSIPETSIRLAGQTTERELEEAGIELAPGRLLNSTRRVKFGDVTKTRAFRESRIAIQDEASQLVAMLLGNGERILDCCAAPGGKTRVIAENNPYANVLAVEMHPHRADLLRERVPNKNVQVITADVQNLSTMEHFDRVLADVPCSGTGTLARNPEIKWRLRPEDFSDLQQRQQAILHSAMKRLAPGGKLIYSTCSLETEENTEVVESVLLKEPSFRQIDCRDELAALRRSGELIWHDLDSLLAGIYLRTLPGVHPCDGFFVAVLTRD